MSQQRDRLELRALEPVAQCLIRKLLVPDVYFEFRMPNGDKADVLLVNRAGTSDLHVVEMRSSLEQGLKALDTLANMPAHYRWLAVPLTDAERTVLMSDRTPFYPPSGAGRTGLIEVVRMNGDDLGADVVWKAERFHGQYRDGLQEAFRSRRPDLEFG